MIDSFIPQTYWKEKDSKNKLAEKQKNNINGGKIYEEVFLNNPFIADDVFVYVDSVYEQRYAAHVFKQV